MIEGVYINLDRSTGRRSSMESQLAEIEPGYPVRRFAAIDGRELADCPVGLRPAQHGCWLSHLQAWQQFAAAGEHLHVMEDDALLSSALPALPDVIEAVEAGSGGAWDLLCLDATLIEVPDMYRMFEWTQASRSKGVVHVHRIPQDFTVYGMHSYVVNSSRKQHVLDYFKRHFAAGKPIDNVLAHGIQRGHLQAYLTSPFVTSGSDQSLVRTVGESGDDQFVAWLMFRRLCFWQLADADLSMIEDTLPALMRGADRHASALGSLLAYRIARWPQQRFHPGVEPPNSPIRTDESG